MLFLSRKRRTPTPEATYLAELMSRPQRHRLLHGYPLAGALLPRNGAAPVAEPAAVAGRGLLVGVLPHPFCNPKVTGCGFCTFPHEDYDAGRAAVVVDHVIQEIEQRMRDQPRRKVAGLYFGGGTANLTPSRPFRRLCRALARAFDLSDAEVTLEGVPAYFTRRDPLLIDVMREEMPARHFRVSMGIQTFDPARLRAMGRQAFGDAATFLDVVELAHARGMTASADLLFNLPHQTLAEMRRDLDRANALGLDHLGLYHLVLFRGLGTAWSRDPDMLAGVPDNEAAARNWVALREHLFDAGFRQTTLTNFERRSFAGDPRRFVYEEYSFRPDAYEVTGFGPGAISFAADALFLAGRKLVNAEGASAYIQAVRSGQGAWDRWFGYDIDDMDVLLLTRRLAALSIDRADIPVLSLGGMRAELDALEAAGLVVNGRETITPTARGCFYADAIAALFAWRRVRERRAAMPKVELPALDTNAHGHM